MRSDMNSSDWISAMSGLKSMSILEEDRVQVGEKLMVVVPFWRGGASGEFGDVYTVSRRKAHPYNTAVPGFPFVEFEEIDGWHPISLFVRLEETNMDTETNVIYKNLDEVPKDRLEHIVPVPEELRPAARRLLGEGGRVTADDKTADGRALVEWAKKQKRRKKNKAAKKARRKNRK